MAYDFNDIFTSIILGVNLGLTINLFRRQRRVAQEEAQLAVQNYRKYLIKMNPKRVQKGSQY